jgi:hypothetical protein
LRFDFYEIYNRLKGFWQLRAASTIYLVVFLSIHMVHAAQELKQPFKKLDFCAFCLHLWLAAHSTDARGDLPIIFIAF